MIGTTISHYRIDEEIGRGGMGVVYKATDTKLDRSVALKFLPKDLSADEEAKVRFIQEAKSASSLDHQNICTIHEIGEDENGTVFIAMAYYEGQTIRKKISDATVGIEDAIDYAIQISKGLAVAHKAEIIHRDIKPGNLMVTGDGVVKILDFGLAKVSGSSITREGKRYGTVLYMSPEQARGERVSPATDLWSLGTVLYEIATGIRPFDAPYESAIFYAIINADPVPPSEHNPDIPPALEQIILRCLEKTISDRYTSAEDLVKDLERLRSGDTATLTTAVNGKKVQKTGGGLSDVIPEVAVSGDHLWVYTVNVATDTSDVPHVCILAENANDLGVFVYFSDRRSAKAEWSNNAFTAEYVAGTTLVVGGSCAAAGAASATDQG